MRGTILNYDTTTHKGIISGHDGQRYHFTRKDIQSSKSKIKNEQEVDFDTDGKDAVDIIFVLSEKAKSKTMALWAFGFGLFLTFGTMHSLSDKVVENFEMLGVIFWNVVILILFLKVWLGKRGGFGFALTAQILAILSFLASLGDIS